MIVTHSQTDLMLITLRIQLLSAWLLIACSLLGQLHPIDVADLTIKVGGLSTEEIYYGFCKGDRMVFSFEEMQGKELKEVEIIELPGSSKFMDFKVNKIENKHFTVFKKAVYQFRFTNSALGKRICKIKIQRIPPSEDLIVFNTDWKWATQYDTSYIPYTVDSLIRYDTSYVPIKKKEKITDDVELVKILDNHSIEVHSKEYNWTLSGEHYDRYNEEIVRIDLPLTSSSELKKVENLEWYYSVSVNQKMKLKTQQTKQNLMNIAGTAASYIYGPQMKVGFEVLNNLTNDHSDQSIYCALIPDNINATAFQQDLNFKIYREDNIVSSPGIRRDSPLSGTVYLGLENKNETQGVTVFVNCYAWRRTQTFRYVNEIQQKITPVYQTLHKSRMVINSTQIRINAY